MKEENSGFFVNDGEVLGLEVMARRFGRSEDWVKQIVRKNGMNHRDLGSGVVLISGRQFREWVEAGADPAGGEKPTTYRERA